MRRLNTSRQRSTVITSNKELVTGCTTIHKACAKLQDELDERLDRTAIPKPEYNELSKRVKELKHTAARVLTALQ